MTLNNPRFDASPSAPPSNHGVQALNRIQAVSVSTARRWAVDEVGAAMAHQLSEPLTALLLYLQEIKKEGERTHDAQGAPDSMQEMVELALRETERVCNIVRRMDHTFGASIDTETALARGREAIDSWAAGSNATGNGIAPPASHDSGQRFLTPRECEVLTLITEGASNKEGGYRLGISKRTFEAHRAHIMDKLGARNAADLVRLALSEFSVRRANGR